MADLVNQGKLMVMERDVCLEGAGLGQGLRQGGLCGEWKASQNQPHAFALTSGQP